MAKEIIKTNKAPGAIGPYSQGIKIGDFVYTSGQIPLNPETGVMAGSIEEQTAQSLENVKAILEAAGTSMDKVIKTTVFLSDMNDFVRMNEVYATYFTENQPARSAVEVAKLPKDAKIEIGVCAKEINFEIEDNKIKSVSFVNGCPGNLMGVSKLVEGMEVDEAISKLKGIDCRGKGTSCPDQLAKALEEYKKSL